MSEDKNHGQGSGTKNSAPKGKDGQHQKDKDKDSFHSKYKILDKIGEGSYSEVLKCRHRESGTLVACKRLKHNYKNWHQVNDIAEIATMRALPKHVNILQMVETHFDQPLGKVSLVFEIMDLNLYELIKDRKKLLAENRVRMLMFQLMRAIRHLHKHGIFHRDIKPENILLKSKTDLLKLGDLGSVRGLYSRPPYTEYISTRWYRSPECLLTAGYYSFKMDIWAAACVFYETMTLRPLFPGSSEIDQVNRINQVMGPPPNRVLQKFFKQFHTAKGKYRNRTQQARWDYIKSSLAEMSASFIEAETKSKSFDWYFNCVDEETGLDDHLPDSIPNDAKDLIISMLSYDPDARPTAHRVLCHPYFKDMGEYQRDYKEKCPTLSVLVDIGDERTKEALMNMEIDLRTLGDKKVKRQKQQKYALIQKQTEAKLKSAQVASKPSTLILERGSSPCTPELVKQRRLGTTVIPEAARVNAIEMLKKQTNQPKKVIGANRALEIAHKRLSIRRRDPEHHERKPTENSVPKVTTREMLLKNKIDAMIKTKNAIASSLESKQSTSTSTFSPFPRTTAGNANAIKAESIAKKIMAADKASNLQQVYLSKVMERKDVNKNIIPSSSSKSNVGKEKIISTLKAPPALRYETVIKTKLPALMRTEDLRSPKAKGPDAMTSSMFPRNRMGLMTRSTSSTKSSIASPKFPQNGSQSERRQPTSKAGSARTNISLPAKIDHLSSYPAQKPKPPLPPPKRVRLPIDIDPTKEEPSVHEVKTLGDAVAESPRLNISNESTVPNVGSPTNVDQASEAAKRRAARIKGTIKDDVYCSSDEEILTSMRQKFDELISQRVQQYYPRSNVDSDGNTNEDVEEPPRPFDPLSERAERIKRYTTKLM